ncbi:MAG: CHAT domain-containing protein [Chloroflexi bacterium]|nr:CHAT domain-containing protein [Chloroflexota bacterium]
MGQHAGYLDFEVRVDRADDGGFVVRARMLGGRAEARFSDPFTADKRTSIRQTLTIAALRPSAPVRSAGTDDVKAMRDFGRTLFDQVIREQIREIYYRGLGQANEQGKGLRLRLVLEPGLEDLPWEFLCSPESEFLALDPQTPVVRFIEQPTPVAPLKHELPLNLLVVIASPKDQKPLNTQAEKARIAAALQPLEAQGYMRVSYLEGPETWSRLIDALRPDETHILHFIGHGAFDSTQGEGVLLMEGASGETLFVGSERLRILVRGKRKLRLAVLNSCLGTAASEAEHLSSVAASLVRAGVPAVVAMQFEISDGAARMIAETFYESLALNFPVDAALTEARREIALMSRDSLEWGTPVLIMQVPDGKLFDFSRPAEASRSIEEATTGSLVEDLYRRAEAAFADQRWDDALKWYKTVAATEPHYKQVAERIAQIEKIWSEKSAGAKAVSAPPGEQAARLMRGDEEFLLDRDRTQIGRNPDNHIVVSDVQASRRHAVIRREGSAFILEDLGGANGTWLNDRRVITPTALNDKDVIRIGETEFVFHSPQSLGGKTAVSVKLPPELALTPRMSDAKPVLDLDAKAAERYRAGEQAAQRGEWAEAVAGYKGALLLVSDYRDAAQKLAFSERKAQCTTLYQQARQQYAQNAYSKALSTLSRIRNLEPTWPDPDNLQVLAECGQLYQTALSALRAKNKDHGAALLRQIIAKRPDFLDAAARLENLAEGGDGLFGAAGATPGVGPQAQAPGAQPQQPAPAARVYELPGADLALLAETLRQWLAGSGYQTQVLSQESTVLVQGRKEDRVRYALGLAYAATVILEPTPNGLKASIGGGKWADTAVATTAAGIWLTGGFSILTVGYGAIQQKNLEYNLWQQIESYLASRGGKRVQ